MPGPAVARLADGSSVVVWVSGNSLLAQRLASDGTLMGAETSVATLDRDVLAFAVTPLAGGDWVVAWISQIREILTMLAVPYGLETKRFSASGAVVQDRKVIAEMTAFDSYPQLKPTSDGGYVLAWAGSPYLTAPQQVVLARFAPDGSETARAGAGIAGNTQSRVQVVPLADGSFVLATRVAQTTSGAASHSIWTQHFSASLTPLRPARELEGTSAAGPFPSAAAPAGNDRVGVVWLSDPGSDQVSWQVIDTSGAPVSAVASQRFAPVVDQLEALGTPDGFMAFVQVRNAFSRGVNAQVTALSISSSGSLVSTSTFGNRSLQSISPTTGATTGPAGAAFSVSGIGDGHFVAAYESGTASARDVRATAR